MKLDGKLLTQASNYKLEHREGSEKYAAGFQSIATIAFTVIVDEDLDDIYKLCIKFDAHAQYPIFSIKDRETLFQAALKQGTEKVKEKLARECALLGVSPHALNIHNWSIGYAGMLPQGAGINSFYNNSMGVTGPSGNFGPTGAGESKRFVAAAQKLGSIYQECLDYIPLEPGVVSIQVPVQVNYVWSSV